jgi:hypothetical protein
MASVRVCFSPGFPHGGDRQIEDKFFCLLVDIFRGKKIIVRLEKLNL